jgi:hypothetical protein
MPDHKRLIITLMAAGQGVSPLARIRSRILMASNTRVEVAAASVYEAAVLAPADCPALRIRRRVFRPGDPPNCPRQGARDRAHRQRRQAPELARWRRQEPRAAHADYCDSNATGNPAGPAFLQSIFSGNRSPS